MDSEPPLIKKQSSTEFESPIANNGLDQLATDAEDPYSLSSTSTSLMGLAIVFLMLGIPLLAVLTERTTIKKINIPTSIDQNGSKSSSSFSLSWVGKPSS